MANLYTVWHTGTNYFANGLRQEFELNVQHVNNRLVVNENELNFTAYRDPYKVCASWINRGHFKERGTIDEWRLQWSMFEKLVDGGAIVLDLAKGRKQQGLLFPKNPINTSKDRTGSQKAVEQGNYEHLYQYVPKEHIDFAIDKAKVYMK